MLLASSKYGTNYANTMQHNAVSLASQLEQVQVHDAVSTAQGTSAASHGPNLWVMLITQQVLLPPDLVVVWLRCLTAL